MAKIKVLVVEDDDNLGVILTEYLTVKNYDATLATDGELGWEKFNSEQFDFCILDVMMPKKDGFSLAKEIRSKNQHIPIIFLTAKSLKEDTIEGLKIGADDYITKPFSMEELLARMEAVWRRTQVDKPAQAKEEYVVGKFKFKPKKRELELNGEVSKLTSKESQLLDLLCQNKNQVLDRAMALNAIWQDDSYFNSRSMDVYVTKLRKHLKQDPAIEILNIHGQGFRLQD